MKLDEIANSHGDVFAELRAAGILANLHDIPVYRQPDFARYAFDPREFPEAERYYKEAISLPLFAGLAEEERDRVVSSLRNALV